MSINDFFEQLDAQFKKVLIEDIFNLEETNLAYNDTILDELIKKIEYFCDDKSFDEMNDIVHMCKHYSDEFIRKYISAHCSELNVELVESIYDSLYKQMAVFIGLDLSSMEEIPELKQYLDVLTKGV